MVAIPFGLVGAVVGHWIVGFDVTLLSMFGMVALAGIVVNDSLVLVDLVNRRVRAGGGVYQSVEEGARIRFRPIILTTLTTVAGITPLLFERSLQAQVLKPMAVSIVFGLMFATMLTLLVVPSLYLVGNDIRRALSWLRTGQWVSPEAVIKRDEAAMNTDNTNTIQTGGA
jgi:multidrug efflux pump subunit AcrB